MIIRHKAVFAACKNPVDTPRDSMNRIGRIILSCMLLAFQLSFAGEISEVGRLPAQEVFENGGNIFLKENHKKIQLTFDGNNSSPVLSPDGTLVAYVHSVSGKAIETGAGEGGLTELWIAHPDNARTEKLVSPRSAEDMSNVIAGITDIQFSGDSRTIFFSSKAWATSGAVHKVNVVSKKESFVTPGNSLKLIRKGKYKGLLKVNQHRYHKQGGSYNCDYIFTLDGKEVAALKDSCFE
jgi:hypothetical protein